MVRRATTDSIRYAASFVNGWRRQMRRRSRLPWPRGCAFDHSNLGYSVLGNVIERVSGRPYAQFIRDEVFAPLGMTESSIGLGARTRGLDAPRYPTGLGRVDAYIGATPAASSAYSSVHDLIRFGLFQLRTNLHLAKPIVADRDLDVMQNETVLVDAQERYGLGFWIKESQFGYRVILAQGGASGNSASLTLIPSAGIGVAVATNCDSLIVSDIVDEILSAMLPRYRDGRSHKRSPHSSSPGPAKSATTPFTGTWSGHVTTYRGAVPLNVSVSGLESIRATLGAALPCHST
jgi:CubicO group peptidase (beta-lactamase class C family)